MKNINDFISSIKENKYDTTAGIPNWADFISIDIEAEEMEFFALKDIKDI